MFLLKITQDKMMLDLTDLTLLYRPLVRHLLPSLHCFSSSISPPFRFYSIQKHPIVKHGINPLHMLPLCQSIHDLKKIKSLLVVQGLMEDEPLVGELIRLCFHFDNPEFALKIFPKLDNHSLLLQNLVIRCLSNHGLYEDLLSLYRNCQKSGYVSDNYTFPSVIKACASLWNFRAGKETHCVVIRTGYEQNVVVQTALADMYAKTGHMSSSHKVFERIPKPDLVSWNALLSGYSYNGSDHEVFAVFKKIQGVGFKPDVSTFASVIPVCARFGILDIGRTVHGLALKCGISLEENVVPALVSMYGSCVDLSAARKLFDLLDKKDVVTWNSMISAYGQNQEKDEAFRVYCQMLQENVLPDMITYVSILPSFGDTLYGESVHARVIKHGLEHQPSVVTALLTMYANLGDIDSAQILFDRMPLKSLFSCNLMISGYVQNGLSEEGLTAFREMQLLRLVPDSVSIIIVLTACNRLKCTLLGMALHAYCLRNGYDLNLNTSNALLSFYANSDNPSSSIKLFSEMTTRNVVSWNTLISNCVHKGDIREVISLLSLMHRDNVKFDLVTMISILPSYYGIENLVHGMAVHGHAIKTGFGSDVSLINALISMYANCGDLDSGHLLFEGMQVRTVVSWNALITGYRYNNLYQAVMGLFHQMTMDDQKPNFVTFLNILPICSDQLQGMSIHAYAIRGGEISEPPLLTSLICMYARFSNRNLCRLLFERSDKNNVTMWNALLSAYVQNDHSKHAFASLHEMLQLGVKPDHVTMLTLICACIQLNSIDLVQSLMAFIICKGFENYVSVSNALIDLYCRCGYISVARKVFDGMIGKDAISWSTMINGYGIHGDGEAALALFSKMRSSGFEPDGVSFIGLLSACSHAGLVEQGRKFFNSMSEEYGITPRMEHYACMVDILGRAGQLNEAYDLVKRLPFKPSVSMLESLLGACRIHGDYELAQEVSGLLFNVNPSNCISYVTLSNVYAASGRWSDTSRLRSTMEEIRLRKTPGLSYIEVNGY